MTAARRPKASPLNPYNLTDKELQVMRCLVQGMTQTEVADAFSISIYTVNDRVERVYKKTGVNTLVQAAIRLERAMYLVGTTV